MNRQRAREEVEDVVCVTGEVIVRQGAIVTPAQYAMLEALGKVDNDPTNMILGCALMMLALMVAAGLYMYRYELDIARRPRTLLLLGILYVLVVALALFFRIFNPYFVPTATGLGLLLITLLVRPRLAVFSTILLSVPVALIAGVERQRPVQRRHLHGASDGLRQRAGGRYRAAPPPAAHRRRCWPACWWA